LAWIAENITRGEMNIKKTKKKPKASVKKEVKNGRPTSYRAEYADLAYNYTLLGARDIDLAKFFSTSEQTINAWKKSQPKFLEALKAGKHQADSMVAASLFKRANGYIIKETKTSSGGENDCISITEKEIPADTTAQIFWLKNRQPEFWRDRQEHDHTSKGESINLTIEKTYSKDKVNREAD
jgi:hypothetical protein